MSETDYCYDGQLSIIISILSEISEKLDKVIDNLDPDDEKINE